MTSAFSAVCFYFSTWALSSSTRVHLSCPNDKDYGRRWWWPADMLKVIVLSDLNTMEPYPLSCSTSRMWTLLARRTGHNQPDHISGKSSSTASARFLGQLFWECTSTISNCAAGTVGTAGTVLSQMSHIVIVSVVVYFSNSATFFFGSGTTLPFSRNSLFLTEVSDKITAKICNIHVFFIWNDPPPLEVFRKLIRFGEWRRPLQIIHILMIIWRVWEWYTALGWLLGW